MRSYLKSILNQFFHARLVEIRNALELTQAEMANILVMDERSFADLDEGKTGCSTLTFVLFLVYCCPNPLAFLYDLRIEMETGAKRLSQNTPHRGKQSLSYRLPLSVTDGSRESSGQSRPLCPRCEKPLTFPQPNYCYHCGQRLDWANYHTKKTHETHHN